MHRTWPVEPLGARGGGGGGRGYLLKAVAVLHFEPNTPLLLVVPPFRGLAVRVKHAFTRLRSLENLST